MEQMVREIATAFRSNQLESREAGKGNKCSLALLSASPSPPRPPSPCLQLVCSRDAMAE